MRSFISSLFGIVFLSQVFSQTTSPLAFEESIFDFNDVLEKNGKVSHTFIFRNRGSQPVIIDEVLSGCGCTSHIYSKESVKPGHTGKITISFDPLYRPGFFSKEIVVFSNKRKNTNRLWVKGTVIPIDHPVEEDHPYYFGSGLYLSLKVLSFGNLSRGGSKQIKLRYANNTKQTMSLGFFVEGSDSNLKFNSPGNLAPLQRGVMVFTYTMSRHLAGESVVNIFPVVNGKRLSQPLVARITGI